MSEQSDSTQTTQTGTNSSQTSGYYYPPDKYGYVKQDILPKYWRDKYERDAHKYWDKFYKVNKDHFWKDRHWIIREFEELANKPNTSDPSDPSDQVLSLQIRITALEVGCGVGNTVFPLLEKLDHLFFYAVDFAPTAIDLLKKNELYTKTQRCVAEVCDVVKEDVGQKLNIPDGSLDFVIMIFVLSAISPEHYPNVIDKLVRLLKPNGMLLFRDYGLGDLAQERFAKQAGEKKLDENFYVRKDGTRAYYFSTEFLEKLMTERGLRVVENDYVKRQIENRKLNLLMDRVWIQGRYVKPGDSQ